MPQIEIYCIEFNGDEYQSIFPTDHAEKSQLHSTVHDALEYMIDECGIPKDKISWEG